LPLPVVHQAAARRDGHRVALPVGLPVVGVVDAQQRILEHSPERSMASPAGAVAPVGCTASSLQLLALASGGRRGQRLDVALDLIELPGIWY
jgi:hypothetical protein